MDPSRPLTEQIANAKVLVPTTGVVDAAAIDAARDLRLIAQPAAGYANIDIEAAKQRGIPVTIAPGKVLAVYFSCILHQQRQHLPTHIHAPSLKSIVVCPVCIPLSREPRDNATRQTTWIFTVQPLLPHIAGI